MAHWYTADPHFGHDNIIALCNRPFRSVSEMDSMLLANFAALVQPDDDLWIVGDFAFGRTASKPGHMENVFSILPGRKHLIKGNHDHTPVRALPWASVQDMATVQDGDQTFVLCHYPMITWNGARKGALNLFGHVHNNWQGTRNSLNVGVDVWDFKPIQARDILRRAKTLPVNIYWQNVEPKVELE